MGTSREIVTHYMNQFRRQGYLRYSRKGIILYRDALQEAAARDAPTLRLTRELRVSGRERRVRIA